MHRLDVPVLRPFNGFHHALPDGCPKVLTTFASDNSGRVAYSFNSMGFRGEEFQPSADSHIFVGGCSLTFGLGLEYSDTWPSVFRREYAEIHGLAESRVNLCNFATSGCCNGYIARTIIGQCLRFRPGLALVLLTYPERTEILHNGRSYPVGRWCLQDSFDDNREADGQVRELRLLLRSKAKAHYEFYDQLTGEQSVLKNALLLQLFFQAHQIPFLVGLYRQTPLYEKEILAPWFELLDTERVFTVFQQEVHVDPSIAVPDHPGIASSRAMADKFLSRYKQLAEPLRPHGTEQLVHAPSVDPQRSRKRRIRALSELKTPIDQKLSPETEDPNVYPMF